MDNDYCLVCGGSTADSYAADLCDTCDNAIFAQPAVVIVR